MLTTIKIVGKNLDSIKEFYKMLKGTSETKKYLCVDKKASWDFCDPIKGITIYNRPDGLYEYFITGSFSDDYVLGDMFLSTYGISILLIEREDKHNQNIVSFEEVSRALNLEIYARNTWFDNESIRYVIEDLLVKNGEIDHYDEQELYVLEKTPLGNVSEISATDYLFFE